MKESGCDRPDDFNVDSSQVVPRAARTIQNAWHFYNKIRNSSRFRDLLFDEQYRCATTIQSAYRCHVSRVELSLRKASALMIVRMLRKYIENKRKNIIDSSVILIQAQWRRFYTSLQYRFDLSDIVFIQSLARKRSAMAQFRYCKGAVLLIQSVVRQWLKRKMYRESETDVEIEWNLFSCEVRIFSTSFF
jgi:hypothetical protein